MNEKEKMMTTKCEHKTSKTLGGQDGIYINRCIYICGEAFITVRDDNGINHVFTADELLTLRERVAILEGKLLVARHWLLGIHVDLYPDQSGDLLAKFSTDEVEHLEALLNELGQLDLGALATAEGGE